MMCNDYRLMVDVASIVEDFADLKIKTMEPSPDIKPYHGRQIVILGRSAWADWLNPSISAKSSIKPLAVGTLSVEQVG
jgi:putative SOS response-associated peptidase YedK